MKKKILIAGGFCLAVFLITTSLGKSPSSFRGQANKPKVKVTAKQEEEEERRLMEEYREKYSLDESSVEYNDFMIQAMSGIVIDAETGKILYEKEMHKKLPPASITKILTGVVALESFELDKKLEVSEYACSMEAFNMSSQMGEKLLVEDLLYALMMISANDASEVLAEGIDGDRRTFLDEMNKKVRLLELDETYFKNPSGLDETDHTSSAHDIGKLTYYAVKAHPDILKYMGKREEHYIAPTEENVSHYWPGHVSQTMRNYPEMMGAKTGFTDAARNTFIGIAQKNGKKFIFIFMGSDRGNEDSHALLNFGLNKM